MEKDKIRRKIKLNWSTNGTLVGAKDLRQDKKTGFLSLGHLWIKINFTIYNNFCIKLNYFFQPILYFFFSLTEQSLKPIKMVNGFSSVFLREWQLKEKWAKVSKYQTHL